MMGRTLLLLGQGEMLNSLFPVICLKAAGAVETSKGHDESSAKPSEATRQPREIFRLMRPDELSPGLLKR